MDGLTKLAVDIPEIAVFAEAAREPARFAVEFMDVFKKAGISPLGPISTILNFVSETGILVGLIDPEKPSELANKYIEVLRSAGLEIGTTKWQMVIPTPSKNIDFDLYVWLLAAASIKPHHGFVFNPACRLAFRRKTFDPINCAIR